MPIKLSDIKLPQITSSTILSQVLKYPTGWTVDPGAGGSTHNSFDLVGPRIEGNMRDTLKLCNMWQVKFCFFGRLHLPPSDPLHGFHVASPTQRPGFSSSKLQRFPGFVVAQVAADMHMLDAECGNKKIPLLHAEIMRNW